MVDGFYERVLADERLADIFVNVAGIELDRHLPRIRMYWEKLLLGRGGYSRHTMNIHRAVHRKRPLREADFERWLTLFRANIDANFEGAGAERAKRVAANVAANMRRQFEAA